MVTLEEGFQFAIGVLNVLFLLLSTFFAKKARDKTQKFTRYYKTRKNGKSIYMKASSSSHTQTTDEHSEEHDSPVRIGSQSYAPVHYHSSSAPQTSELVSVCIEPCNTSNV